MRHYVKFLSTAKHSMYFLWVHYMASGTANRFAMAKDLHCSNFIVALTSYGKRVHFGQSQVISIFKIQEL